MNKSAIIRSILIALTVGSTIRAEQLAVDAKKIDSTINMNNVNSVVYTLLSKGGLRPVSRGVYATTNKLATIAKQADLLGARVKAGQNKSAAVKIVPAVKHAVTSIRSTPTVSNESLISEALAALSQVKTVSLKDFTSQELLAEVNRRIAK